MRIQAASSLEEVVALEYDKQMIFGNESTNFYLHHYHHWTYNSKAHDFKTHIYTNNVREGVDVLYRRLFCVFINYDGLSTDKEELFAIFTTYHNALYISCSPSLKKSSVNRTN
jgi:hypothetical protein